MFLLFSHNFRFIASVKKFKNVQKFGLNIVALIFTSFLKMRSHWDSSSLPPPPNG